MSNKIYSQSEMTNDGLNTNPVIARSLAEGGRRSNPYKIKRLLRSDKSELAMTFSELRAEVCFTLKPV